MTNKSKYEAKSHKEFTKVIPVRLHKENDKDILEWLSKQHNKSGAIKQLIRNEINKGN